MPDPNAAPTSRPPKPRKTVNVAELIKQKKLAAELAGQKQEPVQTMVPEKPSVKFSNTYFGEEKKPVSSVEDIQNLQKVDP